MVKIPMTLLMGLLLLPALATAETAPAPPTVEPVEAEGGQWWPRWRGPGGQGEVADAARAYPDRWSATENVLWKVPVPGRGNASPIVWEDRIFLTTAEGETRAVLAFRRSDGELLWKTAAPLARPEDHHPKNTLASSTPATDGKAVFAYFGNHGLLAVDFAGKVLWHRKLGTFDAYHGTASSPLLYKDRVIVTQDHQGAGGSFIAAFDKKTGEQLWRTGRSARVGWNTPVAVRVGGEDQIVLSSQSQVTAYHPADGKKLWDVPGNTFEAIPTPVVGHDLIFASSGRAGPTLAIRPGLPSQGVKAEVVWKSPKGSPFVPSAVLHGEHLYMVNDMAAIATAYHATTGEVLWQGRLGRAQREGFSASPVVVGDRLFFTNDEGQTFVLQAGKEFQILHVNQLDEAVLASPALVEGKWYFRTAGHLLAIGRPPA
jgi:outer membrane protein assembly factor BamB